MFRKLRIKIRFGKMYRYITCRYRIDYKILVASKKVLLRHFPKNLSGGEWWGMEGGKELEIYEPVGKCLTPPKKICPPLFSCHSSIPVFAHFSDICGNVSPL
jgi:hypothetical protein